VKPSGTPDDFLFPALSVPQDVLNNLQRMNPWWRGDPSRPTPITRRHLVSQIHRRLQASLAPIIVVRGPRQIGKSTAQMQVIEDLLGRGTTPSRIFRIQFDELPGLEPLGAEPILRLVDWYEHGFLHSTINALARGGEKVFLFLDEVQNLKDWDVQLKFLVDHTAVQVVVTGSSALRIERGLHRLAGRTVEVQVILMENEGERGKAN
jgi:predicted AAA+ superfamily ATPase